MYLENHPSIKIRSQPWDENVNFNALERNISDTMKIPKKIHQIWINSLDTDEFTFDFPPHKKKFMNSVKKTYSDYTYKLWRNDDLTK